MTTITETDRAALEQALEQARNQNEGRRAQIDAKLAEDDWLEVAHFAAFCCQFHALHLPPYELPPCSDGVLNQPEVWPEGAKLLAKMLARGISRFHPDPMAALNE